MRRGPLPPAPPDPPRPAPLTAPPCSPHRPPRRRRPRALPSISSARSPNRTMRLVRCRRIIVPPNAVCRESRPDSDREFAPGTRPVRSATRRHTGARTQAHSPPPLHPTPAPPPPLPPPPAAPGAGALVRTATPTASLISAFSSASCSAITAAKPSAPPPPPPPPPRLPAGSRRCRRPDGSAAAAASAASSACAHTTPPHCIAPHVTQLAHTPLASLAHGPASPRTWAAAPVAHRQWSTPTARCCTPTHTPT
jgi:hypothetical protein